MHIRPKNSHQNNAQLVVSWVVRITYLPLIFSGLLATSIHKPRLRSNRGVDDDEM
jgi:hypothetical protein